MTDQHKPSPPLSRPLAILYALSKQLDCYEEEHQQTTLSELIRALIKPGVALNAAQELYQSYCFYRTINRETLKERSQSTQSAPLEGLEGLTTGFRHLLSAKDYIERSPQVESLLGLDHTSDLFLYQMIAKLSHKAYLLRLFEAYKHTCKDEVRPLADDERSILTLSIWLTHLATGEELRLVDPHPNDLWVSKSMDSLSPSCMKHVERSLMPSLQKKSFVERRGLVLLQSPSPTTQP